MLLYITVPKRPVKIKTSRHKEIRLGTKARESGEHCKLPQWGSGAEPQLKSILVHFSLKILHLVATILILFLRIN